MKINVDNINNNVVSFSSEFGNGLGIWVGEYPHLNKEYHVEFEIRKTIKKNDVHLSESNTGSIEVVNDRNLLTMQLIDYENTGCATFLLGDLIVDIETQYDLFFPSVKNKFLEICIDDLYIYAYEI